MHHLRESVLVLDMSGNRAPSKTWLDGQRYQSYMELLGSPGTPKYRWVKKDDRFRDEFSNSITYSRYLEIKRYFKLNFNHEEAKRGTPEYDPCAKYDYIVKTLIHNMNYCTAAADLDQTIDESTWPSAGYSGEAGGQLINKPVSKGAFLPIVVVHVVQCYAYSMC